MFARSNMTNLLCLLNRLGWASHFISMIFVELPYYFYRLPYSDLFIVTFDQWPYTRTFLWRLWYLLSLQRIQGVILKKTDQSIYNKTPINYKESWSTSRACRAKSSKAIAISRFSKNYVVNEFTIFNLGLSCLFRAMVTNVTTYLNKENNNKREILEQGLNHINW